MIWRNVSYVQTQVSAYNFLCTYSAVGIPPRGQCDILDDRCCEPETYQCNYGGGHSGYICKTPYRDLEECKLQTTN